MIYFEREWKRLVLSLLAVLALTVLLPVVAGEETADWRQASGRVFMVRHGQRAAVVRNCGFDPPLTEKGRKQAFFAARFLKQQGFRGRILASPYRRTLETASIIVGETGGEIVLCPGLQEFKYSSAPNPMTIRSLKELRKEFPKISSESVLPSGWLLTDKETLWDTARRLENVLSASGKPSEVSDILLVSHGALLKGLDLLMTENRGPALPKWTKKNWNCAISEYRLQKGRKPVCIRLFDVSFLPDGFISHNQFEPKNGLR